MEFLRTQFQASQHYQSHVRHSFQRECIFYKPQNFFLHPKKYFQATPASMVNLMKKLETVDDEVSNQRPTEAEIEIISEDEVFPCEKENDTNIKTAEAVAFLLLLS